jgi:hypothetical protein
MGTKTCVFCGTAEKLTAEHVFGDWLTGIGLPRDPVRYGAGPLNRSPRDLGVGQPFTRTVRDVCGPCNHGWMSNLEAIAARVLTPLILGKAGSISEDDSGAIAAWIQKTALVGMLLSSEAERARGYGLPPGEYRALYALRAEPLPASQFWIGRYEGDRRLCSIWATPMTLRLDGLPELELPQAYAMTIVLGDLLLQGVRFTSPQLRFDLKTAQGFPQLWPPLGTMAWPPDGCVNDEDLLRVNKGLNLVTQLANVTLAPWRPATDLERSTLHGSLVKLPTPCGEHSVFYPSELAEAALQGEFHAFLTSCECGKTYLVETERDGAHFKTEGEAAAISSLYEALPGTEFTIEDGAGQFVFKQRPR